MGSGMKSVFIVPSNEIQPSGCYRIGFRYFECRKDCLDFADCSSFVCRSGWLRSDLHRF